MLLIALLCGQLACQLVGFAARSAGPRKLKPTVPPSPSGPYVILFAMDGAGYGQFMDAISSGKATHIVSLVGKPAGPNLYEHAYSVPNAITIIPSCSTAAWASIMTGRPPAETGVAGDEFFVREENRFYAPIPISTRQPDDFMAAIDNDLLGRLIRTPTVYQRITGSSDVALLYVYRGANVYSTIGGSAALRMAGAVIEGQVTGATLRDSIAGPIDGGSAAEAVKVIRQHGIPKLLVVYFPGVDIYAHGAPNPLPMQTQYLIHYVDRDIGEVLDEYSKRGVLRDTYVIFTADHGHTPVLADQVHDLAFGDGGKLLELLKKTGLRVRKPMLRPPPEEQDYQAVFAAEGFAAYVYVANRSTCVESGQRCDWRKRPRFRKDLLPVLRALYRANRSGKGVAGFKGTLDLIFSRDYSSKPARQGVPPFEIFDGRRLVPISAWLSAHPRPDLIEVARRMDWLGKGPYGDRAGDIVMMGKADMSLPIEGRYYFSHTSYFAWHGSLTLQDAHIPLVVARSGASSERLKAIIGHALHNPPSALDVTPLIESLLAH